MTDPYKVLGVSKTSSIEEIKKSYRKLAKKYHPDLNPGNKESEKRFKEISHSFDLIGTAEDKAKFDRGETDEEQQKKYDEFTKNRSRRGESFHQSQRDGGRYAYSFGEDFGGSDFFENIFGAGKRNKKEHEDVNFPGEDLNFKMEVEFRDAAIGGKKNITLPNGKTLEVTIPAGIDSGKRLRFKGLGGPGIGKGHLGDAYIEIEVKPLAGFKRCGRDIEVEVPVSFIEAITGGEIKVPTLEGEILMKIPPGASTGSKLRIKGKGIGVGESRGNEIVVLKVVIPKDIDPDLKAAVENLKSKFDYNPRIQ